MVRQISLLAMLLTGFATTACATDAEYDALEFTQLNFALSGYDSIVASDEVIMTAGIVQPIKARVEYKGDRYLIGSFVDLASKNENLFTVFPMEEKNTFLLVAKAPGETCMDVFVNGEHEECIDVTVE